MGEVVAETLRGTSKQNPRYRTVEVEPRREDLPFRERRGGSSEERMRQFRIYAELVAEELKRTRSYRNVQQSAILPTHRTANEEEWAEIALRARNKVPADQPSAVFLKNLGRGDKEIPLGGPATASARKTMLPVQNLPPTGDPARDIASQTMFQIPVKSGDVLPIKAFTILRFGFGG